VDTELFALCPFACDAGVARGSSRAIDNSMESPVPFRCLARLFSPTLSILDPRFKLEPRFTLELGLDDPSEAVPSSSLRVSFCCMALGSSDLILSARSGYKLNMFR
jgi:hypothetical protein